MEVINKTCRAAAIQPIPNHPESFADDKDTQQMIEKQKQEQLKYAELTKRYEGYRQRLRAEGGLPPELDANLFNKKDEVRMVQEVPMVENENTIIMEGIPKQNESGCELESGALLVKSNVAQEDEELEQNAGNCKHDRFFFNIHILMLSPYPTEALRYISY